MSITLIIGPMFSGKTTELVKLVDRKRIAEKKCVIIKHCCDNRYNEDEQDLKHVTTHCRMRYEKCDVIYLSDLTSEIMTNLYKNDKYDVVAIEEGHFFSKTNNPNSIGILDFCSGLANYGIDVIVSALDSSFRQELFVEIGNLVANAETVIKLSAICMHCKEKDASFNIRIIDNENEILVGGNDIYQCVCRKCLKNFKENNQKTCV